MDNSDVRILVVDDDPDILFATARVVKKEGYEVLEAENGKQCLEKAEKENPDLILLDVHFPDIAGIEVCLELKNNPAHQKKYIIMLSGSKTSSHDQANGLDAGADGYIARPVSNRELVSRVNLMVRLIKAERERAHYIREIEKAAEKIKILSGTQKSESLTRMAGAVAHLFNNQLGAVIGNLEMALEDLQGDAAPVKILTNAMKAARKAAEVGGHMLTYLGQTTGVQAPLDLSELCHHSLGLLQAATPQGLTLKVDLLSPGPTVRANAHQIQQVITNLVTNAWETVAKNKESVSLTVKMASHAEIAAAHRFPIDWQPEDGTSYACLEVGDTGCGIAGEDIDKIFDPFFSTKFTGRGLGLSVVLGIVKTYHGAVTVESQLGYGCCFRILLPVSVEELPRQPKIVQPLAELGNGTILLVDDEEILREMAATRLSRLGYEVIKSRNGLEALEMFRLHQEKILCVLTDLTMPFMDGWEVLAAVRKLSPDMPVILSSGYDEAKIKIMFSDPLEHPPIFLHKPYQKEELQESLAKAIAS